jgi:hypothetical protein
MDGLDRAKQDARAESTNSRRFRRRMEQLPRMRGYNIWKLPVYIPLPNPLPEGAGVGETQYCNAHE